MTQHQRQQLLDWLDQQVRWLRGMNPTNREISCVITKLEEAQHWLEHVRVLPDNDARVR